MSANGPWRAAWRRLRARPIAFACLLFLALVLITSLCAPLLPLASPVAIDLGSGAHAPVPPWTRWFEHGFQPEYWKLGRIDAQLVLLRESIFGDWQTAHWLGTDPKGRDLLARIVWGSRTSLLVAFVATGCSLVIGVGYGAIAGLARRRVDNLMMRFVDLCYSLPFLFLVIFLITLVNSHRAELEGRWGIDREVVFYFVLGLVYWLSMARVVRGQVLALREMEFLQAARALGASRTRILFVHILPNVLSIVIVYLTLTIPAVMLFEAFLSFLGLGIEAPKVSWGLLAVDGVEAVNPIHLAWWLVVWPSAAMGSVLLALNLLGDALRDALDPRLAWKS